MKKNTILKFGVIAGLLLVIFMWVTIPFMKDLHNMDMGEVIGYTSMTLALSTIYFAVRNYRDKALGGFITFGNALGMGLLIALIAAVFYAIGWEIYMQNGGGNFMNEYMASYSEKLKSSGKSPADIQAELDMMKKMAEWYKNPFFRFGWSMFELLPVGLIISLVSAFILKRNPKTQNS